LPKTNGIGVFIRTSFFDVFISFSLQPWADCRASNPVQRDWSFKSFTISHSFFFE
jgi:hypothetical protein